MHSEMESGNVVTTKTRKKTEPVSEEEKAERWVENRERAGLESATPERLARATSDGYERTENNVQRIVEAPLDRMWKKGHITRREYEAGERYRTDAYLAELDPGAPSVDWNRESGGGGPRSPSMFNSQRIADARMRIREMDRRIPRTSTVFTLLNLGLLKEQRFEDIGLSVFVRKDKRELVVAAQSGFRVALAALADQYDAIDRGIKAG